MRACSATGAAHLDHAASLVRAQLRCGVCGCLHACTPSMARDRGGAAAQPLSHAASDSGRSAHKNCKLRCGQAVRGICVCEPAAGTQVIGWERAGMARCEHAVPS